MFMQDALKVIKNLLLVLPFPNLCVILFVTRRAHRKKVMLVAGSHFFTEQAFLVIKKVIPYNNWFSKCRISSGDRSSVGRVQDCDSCCRGFEPRRSPQKPIQSHPIKSKNPPKTQCLCGFFVL